MEQFIQDITVRAGKKVFSRFGKVHTARTKKHALDVVTEADMMANAILIGAIKKQFPGHGIISEETGSYQEHAEYVWIIDPIDGTLNFSKNIPLFAVLVALTRRGVVTMACVYQPVTKELYFARRGKGSYLNGKRIRVSSKNTLEDSVGLVNVRLTHENIGWYKNYLKRYGSNTWVSALGSTGISCMYVADGRADWFALLRSGKVWDYAACSLILTEAGSRLTNWRGEPWKLSDTEMIVSNKKLHPKLMALMSK